MFVYTKLDDSAVALLCCPICKGALGAKEDHFVCSNCCTVFPLVHAPGGRIFDFRIHRPPFLVPQDETRWLRVQRIYEEFDVDFAKRDKLQEYLDEIDSVREIYTEEFHIAGSVLDVGGNQGKLRHFLSDKEVPLYITVDPFVDVFRYAHLPNLLQAYPCLLRPCNFLASRAEHLPFISNSFDWVHMRSVVDHFADPYMAFKEAYRVLKPNGHLLIGLSIVERNASSPKSMLQLVSRKIRSAGIVPVLKAVAGKLTRSFQSEHDDHNFRLKYQELLDLISMTGFSVIKEHWQKPPYTFVIYVSARTEKR